MKIIASLLLACLFLVAYVLMGVEFEGQVIEWYHGCLFCLLGTVYGSINMALS